MHGLRRQATFATITTSSGSLLPGNMKRHALIVSAPRTERVTLSFGGPAVIDQGITLYPGNAPLYLLFDHLGEALHEDIFAIAANSAQTIGLVDVFFF